MIERAKKIVGEWERVKSAKGMCEEGLGRLNIVIADIVGNHSHQYCTTKSA